MSGQQFTRDHVASESKAPVVISLFGAFELLVNGAVVTNFRSNKTRALLVYLLLTHSQPLLRRAISELLWAGYVDQSAQTNLRQTLSNLRDCLAPIELLQSSRTQLSLLRDPALLWCDVHQFDALLDACQHHDHSSLPHCPVCQRRLQQAVALYRAPLLETLPPTDSPPFNAWLAAERSRLAARLATAQAALAAGASVHGNLPPPLTPLIGRSHEMAELQQRLYHSIYRCLSLVGPGGIGKTRLACALGAQMQAHFPAGVWLVELGRLAPTTPDEPPVQLQDRLAAAIATALGLTFYGTTPPATQVANHLAKKSALLILDGFEHLAAGAAWLPTLLTAAPQLRLLITTRQRLPLQSQLVYPVEGLGVPPAEVITQGPTPHLLAQYASLHLFVERATSAGNALLLNETTLITVSQLCRFVSGSPWAIELAVAMLPQQNPAAILAAIQQNYRALTTDLLDVPVRQRSAEAVFLTTWALLTPVEAQTLARCAVFRGGFTGAAAQTVAGATLATLEALVQKSLLRPSGADRYAMHDLVRQFAGEQLALDQAVADQSHTAHATYFTAILATWQPDDATIQHFRTTVTQDWENVQAAWAWAVEAGAVPLLQQGLGGLAEYYNLVELFLEADVTLGNAIARVRQRLDNVNRAESSPADRRALQTLLAHLLWRHCYFVNDALAETERAAPIVQGLLTLAHELADGALTARGYYELSVIAYFRGDSQNQEELLLQAWPLAQQYGTVYDQIVCLNMLGISRINQGDTTAARHYYEQALALTQHGNYALYELMILNNIGFLLVDNGELSAAMANFQQGLARATVAGFKSKVALIIGSLGTIAYLVGDYANARTHLLEAYQRAVDLHDHALAAESLSRLGALCGEVGDDTEVVDYCQQALAASGGHLYTVQHTALCTLGHLYRRQGQWATAADMYQQALALSQESHQASDELRTKSYLAAVALAEGNAIKALAAAEPLLAHFATTPFIAQQRPQELLLIAYQILVANTDPRAAAVLHQAWRYVQEQAAKIDEPRLRHTFLLNVPTNQVLARLAKVSDAH